MGTLYIGAKKALVEVSTVLARGVKVPFQRSGWGEKRWTFGDVADNLVKAEIAVHASQIHKRISGNNGVPLRRQEVAAIQEGGNRIGKNIVHCLLHTFLSHLSIVYLHRS